MVTYQWHFVSQLQVLLNQLKADFLLRAFCLAPSWSFVTALKFCGREEVAALLSALCLLAAVRSV